MYDSFERRCRFIESVDWLSVINDGIPYSQFISDLRLNTNIEFTEKYMFNHQYVVISKNSYTEFFDYFESKNGICRITRLDLKFDIAEPYHCVLSKYQNEFSYSSGVFDKEEISTIYFNSRQSDLFCRLYNKQKESDLDFPLTRLEYEIKGIIMQNFSMRYFYFGLDDALNYLYELITEFNYNKNLLGLFPFLEYKQPIPFSTIVHN